MIYFIQDSLTFRIKIGFTGKDNVKERLAELQTGSSSLLYLLAARPGSKVTESELHREFAKYRSQGEWFNPGPELLNYIIGCALVQMGRTAMEKAAQDIIAHSFPETKAEAERRENELLRRRAAELLASARAAGHRPELVRISDGSLLLSAWPEYPATLRMDPCLKEDVIVLLRDEGAIRTKQTAQPPRYKTGMKINHPKYGEGFVLDEIGEGANHKIRVVFSDVERFFMSSQTEMKIISEQAE